MKTVVVLVMLMTGGTYSERLRFTTIDDCQTARDLMNATLPKYKEVASRSLRPKDMDTVIRFECLPGVVNNND